MIAALAVGAFQAWARSPFREPIGAQKRGIVLPDIDISTSCIARVTRADPDGMVRHRARLSAARAATVGGEAETKATAEGARREQVRALAKGRLAADVVPTKTGLGAFAAMSK